jgi:hypothetical protein
MVPKKGDTIKRAICHLKQKIPRMQQKNRVYKFDCADCKKWYIGDKKWRAGNTDTKMM